MSDRWLPVGGFQRGDNVMVIDKCCPQSPLRLGRVYTIESFSVPYLYGRTPYAPNGGYVTHHNCRFCGKPYHEPVAYGPGADWPTREGVPLSWLRKIA